MVARILSFCVVSGLVASVAWASGAHSHGQNFESEETVRYWMKVKAFTKEDRSAIAETGVSLEVFKDDYVIAIGDQKQRDQLKKQGRLLSSFELEQNLFDFPSTDSKFHNYAEMTQVIQDLAKNNPDIVALDSLGQSVEGREIYHLRISKDPATATSKPGVVFMGGHHAREHVSIEMPILLASYLVDEYRKNNPQIVNLVDNRDIHIIPMVNPDGAEFDIATGRYQTWRKNRTTNRNGSKGVDLNRNYSFQWGTGGSSSDPGNETFKGVAPFSEPETQAIKSFIEAQTNISTLLTFHTFSELILYPWGHKYNPITQINDMNVFKTMAETMAGWNGYRPMQASELYIASGDTCDWAYGEHKIFAFTFELDPDSQFRGGFYPGQAIIPTVFNKNIKPMLYLMEYADNPYRVLNPEAGKYGLNHFPFLN